MAGKDLEEQPRSADAGQVVFRGHFNHNLDEKGRVSLPRPFRQALGEASDNAVVLTNYVTDGARCLDGFSSRDWAVLEQRLAARSRFDAKLRQFENFYVARASDCAVDGQGRITVPSYLRAYAGLDKEVVFTAALRGFRLWDVRVWDLVFQESEKALLDDPSLFINLDL